MTGAFIQSSLSNILQMESNILTHIEDINNIPRGAAGDKILSDMLASVAKTKAAVYGTDKVSVKYRAYLTELEKTIKEAQNA